MLPLWALNLVECVSFDLFCNSVLVLFLALFVYLHANHFRALTSKMADTLAPQTPSQTPPKKLFKPSSKTKTPTPVRKTNSTNATPRSAQSSTQSGPVRSPEDRRSTENYYESAQSPAQSTDSPSRSLSEDIIKSTPLAPLTGSSGTTKDKLPDYPTSDTTGDTAVGVVDHEVLTPSDTVSRSTGAARSLSTDTSDPQKHKASGVRDSSNTADETTSSATKYREKQSQDEREDLDSQRQSEGAQTPSNLAQALESPTDIANYFERSGNQEMSSFVNALAGNASSGEATKDANDAAKLRDTTHIQDTAGKQQVPDVADKTPDLDPSPVSHNAEGIVDASEATHDGVSENSTPNDGQRSHIGDPEASNISSQADSQTGNLAGNAKKRVSRRGAAAPKDTNDAIEAGHRISEDGTKIFDNMGKPAHIEQRIEIPFERPQRRQSVVHSPPVPSKPDFGNLTENLGNVKDLPNTDDLPTTNDLEDIPEDPPEEILDESVHSPANVTPIPKIPKITPIGMAPPSDLFHLARGLKGKIVDDVGNIVDESGTVLGHAMGDLPAMVGQKVASSGEVHDDNGELVGYVTENFTGPSSAESSGNPWEMGNLQIDHNGNILDGTGNAIGRFFQKPGEKGGQPPSKGSPQQNPNPDQNAKQEEKPKVNAHTGGSPSDIFMDVKSTTDGIQLTIRIPTTFGLQRQEESQGHESQG